jgi:hypothetical protein
MAKYRFLNWVICLNEVVALEEWDNHTIFIYMKSGQTLRININLSSLREKNDMIKSEKEKLFRTFEELDS